MKLPFTTYTNLVRAVMLILPDAYLDEDDYGQLVIYTNLSVGAKDRLKRFDAEKAVREAYALSRKRRAK